MHVLIIQQQGFFTQLSNRFSEGGALFMSLILICLILSLFFLISGFYQANRNEVKSRKMISLVSDSSLLGLVIGFLGSIIGLISAFDAIEGMNSISSGMLAGGLKVSFLTTLFGTLVFVISRIGILIYKWMYKI
ncbi:MotA/TolQ/ExbB proton channel family protein [Formosa sp. PL04]|uniref:MotA/TolQ/ExbB proton channel family protein n=1 Tax=Formosa sp. PL04 TaxID=3081755 RepID=UPI00298229F7|nr:MotA/TolQ/ExbB proton channel family protein [Formosa sp. PL04]MDW5289880.1 MotA/TolQ/ExbB proton channel family protein [Formosa sp. PL04]